MTDDNQGHKLGSVLRAAREAKGVDLARVERDTKIRSRYLSALEQGDYRDLPGAVYTKGFVRNYGAYLGLDPEYLIDLYRLESATAPVERISVPTPPRPITTRRRSFVITPGAVAAAVLTAIVAFFIVYLVGQFVTFARTPALTVTDPAGNLNGYTGLEYTIRGVTEPNSRVTVDGLRENPTVTADAEGNFAIDVQLVPGANVITLSALDPVTNRPTPDVSLTITVARDLPSPSPGEELAVTSPEEGASLTGPASVAGTAAPGAELTVTATFVGPAPATFRITTLAGADVPLPTTAPTAPEPMTLTAGASGEFSGELTLPVGSWALEVLAEGAGEPVSRRVNVPPPAGLSGRLTVSDSASYLEIDEDGTPMANISGRIANPGADVELDATDVLRIRVGNAGAVRLVINGIDLGVMGGSGAVVEWRLTRL